MIASFLHNGLSFLIIISIIVFVHEFGHYIIAKISGVKIEAFSIGFGKEIFSRKDSSGTIWKLCLLPIGGYVRMYGDSSAASDPDLDKIQSMGEEEKKLTFHNKPLYIKSLIVAAGPLANFIFAILIFTGIFFAYGKVIVSPVVSYIQENSSAQLAGLELNDRVIEINKTPIKYFSDIEEIVSSSLGEELTLVIERNGEQITKKIKPKMVEIKDVFGNKIRMPRIGIASKETELKQYSIFEALPVAVKDTYTMTRRTVIGLGEIIRGKRDVDEMGGPITIARYSGQSTKNGLATILWFMAILSINLGLMNLIPIPALDGGHLFLYLVEAVIRKPVPEKIQMISFRFGVIILSGLMIFCTFNDLKKLFFN